MPLDTFFFYFLYYPFWDIAPIDNKANVKHRKKLLYRLVLHNNKTLNKTANCNTVFMICDKLQLLVLFEMHTVSLLISLKHQVGFNLIITITFPEASICFIIENYVISKLIL